MAEVMMNEMEGMAARLGIGLSQVDLDSIRLPPGEDFGNKSEDDDVFQEDNLEFDSGFGNIIVVDNLPVVALEKFEKLEGVIRKIYSQIGVIKDDGLWMPLDPDTKKTLGYCFIEYITPQEAELAKEKTHGDKLDRAHIFVVNMFDDFDRFMKVPNEWAPPEIKPYTPGFWTESFVQWSPLGTYLDTVHRQGAAVWGGASTLNWLMRYAHPQVRLIDFSPGEKYLVTYSSHEPSNPRDATRVVINIFDVRTGQVMRDFKGTPDVFAIGGTGETFSLVDMKSLKVENVMDFSWSPTDPILALFVAELGGGNQPARVSLVQIPTKEELRQKILFSLFGIKERDIPIEVLELENKNDKIIAFAWEPKGHRFAVIHGDNPRPDISFYSMRTAQHTGRVSKLTALKGKQANALFWSPAGRFIILAGLKGFNGQLEFYNVDELETMATAEHFMATDIEWDPTGRYVATAVTSVHEMENGFNIWSFNGKLLYRILKDHFFQKYSKKYEAEDQDVSMLLSGQDREKRGMLKEEWDKWVSEWKRLHEEERLERQKLRDGEASDEEDYEAKEVEVEELLDVSEEILPFEYGQE
ncbi:hypothetical protein FNV43_RR11334 [Rhamnella rubrinervis]|uniref:Eukaryotic translation initiation factor 3 subunit B n=1 Tax=Rhamnella rubrinervis TaxID=2594499 RepID=A0A8K0H5N0_9ROSA|nr:hypothetical protein FNV43_RR11334 [Rhamnella rubrinervis]